MVWKPTLSLEQVILRLKEWTNISRNLSYKAANATVLKMPHYSGPLPTDTGVFSNCVQYRAVQLKSYTISLSDADNCVQIGSDVVLVRNIISNDCDTYVAYNSFLCKEDFFTYPTASSNLGIFQVSNVSTELKVANLQTVKVKYVLLPYRNKMVALPIIHITSL